MKSGRWIQQTLVLASIALLAVLLVYPILLTVRGGFAADPATGRGWTLDHLLLVFEDPTTVSGLVNALTIAIGTTLPEWLDDSIQAGAWILHLTVAELLIRRARIERRSQVAIATATGDHDELARIAHGGATAARP